MSRKAVEELVDRWINDEGFQAEMRQDPEGAVKRTGLELDEDEWAALRVIDWNLTNEELMTRSSSSTVNDPFSTG